ncbi:TPA: hypothetical protein I9742_002940 [Serratia marcescens]|nr:hypothetical protein [Serratia marcescens]
MIVTKVFIIVVFLLVPNAFSAMVNIDWKLDSTGKIMNYKVLSADYPEGDNTSYDCGGWIFKPKCKVVLYLDAGWPIDTYWLPLKGKQSSRNLVASWALPVSGTINDWDKWVQTGLPPCIFIQLANDLNAASFANSCSGGVTVPPVKPPQPQVSCSISGAIYLQHGSLTDSEVHGHRTNSTARVYCTGVAKVKVSALSGIGTDSALVKLRADGSLQSILSVNGFMGSSGAFLDVPGPSGKDVEFSSTLFTAGKLAAGDFSGSAVAVIDIL